MFKGHPKGLIWAALSNMGERFGYYIMNAMLLLFLCSKFGLDEGVSGKIYSVFYALIYVLSLVGGLIADRKQNYKGTIMVGLIVMALGYVMLAYPTVATAENTMPLLIFTCVSLLMISFGNGLFKGNLQAIVGQMYDDLEAEEAKKGPDALKIAKEKRDSGFQIFYMFINVGGLVAPFIAPALRKWWLAKAGLTYNAALPALCHKFINDPSAMTVQDQSNLAELVSEVSNGTGVVSADFCANYLNVFNTGVHIAFWASVVAMLISLVIFICTRKMYPTPAKKVAAETSGYTAEEKVAMAKEIKQRLYALFAVLGIAIFFWLSFHQNTQSLTVFARDFIDTSSIPPEMFQAINPFFVVLLTFPIMWIFAALARKGKSISTPKKIAIGMGIAGCAYLFLMILSIVNNFPSATEFRGLDVAEQNSQKLGLWVMIVTYFFLTVAELFISPLGLSFVSKVAPKHMLGICQGLWLGATAVGNLFIWIGTEMCNKVDIWICWGVFLAMCFVSMCVMLGMVKWLERVAK